MQNHLTLIQGGLEKDEEVLQKLRTDPAQFSSEEFRALNEKFRSQIELPSYFSMLKTRYEAEPFEDVLLHRMFIATLEGRDEEADELAAKFDKSRDLGIRQVK